MKILLPIILIINLMAVSACQNSISTAIVTIPSISITSLPSKTQPLSTLTPYPSPTVTPTPLPSRTYLTELLLTKSRTGFSTLGKGVFPFSEGPIYKGTTLEAHGVKYPHGLFAHAPSTLTYQLNGLYTTLSTDLVMTYFDTDCSDGATFVILVDGREAYKSPLFFNTTLPIKVEVDIRGAQELTLMTDMVGDYGCDWTTWGDPQLLVGAEFIVRAIAPTATATRLVYESPAAPRVPYEPCEFYVPGKPITLLECPFQRRQDFYVGGVAGQYPADQIWGPYWTENHPLEVMQANGFKWLRVGVTTDRDPVLGNTPTERWHSLGWEQIIPSSVEYTRLILEEGARYGYRLNLFFFLSNTEEAHAGRQDAPPEWKDLSLEETAILLEDYTYQTTLYFQQAGLDIEIYDIGNEIEWGILNFRPDERIPSNGKDKTQDMSYMKNKVWLPEAYMLKAAISGVKRADPGALIVLHIDSLMNSHNNDIVNRYFFETMVAQEVPFDIAGLSYPYPQGDWIPGYLSAEQFYNRFQKTLDFIAALDKKVLISEASYMSFPCSGAGWPMKGYDYSSEGQAKWVRDQLRFLSNQENVIGFFYWAPEWFIRPDDPESCYAQAYGLFYSDKVIKPAMLEFQVNR